MQDDVAVREQVCRLRRAKDWMRTGFADAMPPSPPRAGKLRTGFRPGHGVAASLMALVLASGGALIGYTCAERGAPLVAQQQESGNILLHLDQSDPARFAAVLDYAEAFLAERAAGGARVEVVANAGGIDLLRSGGSVYTDRVLSLQRKYGNLQFIACANAIRNLRNQGDDISLLNGVHGGETAVDHIVGRLQQGWRYVKISELPGI
jgi:intracellular sulfur oxidation DsrE/DsrF family protein